MGLLNSTGVVGLVALLTISGSGTASSLNNEIQYAKTDINLESVGYKEADSILSGFSSTGEVVFSNQREELLSSVMAFAEKLLIDSEKVPSEFNQTFNENFWDLLA